jgi:hypothetical protein
VKSPVVGAFVGRDSTCTRTKKAARKEDSVNAAAIAISD